MLKYEFSKREKALVGIFVIIIIALLWYQFVFVNTQQQREQLESQISQAQADTTLATAQLAQLSRMEAEISQYKKDGAKKVVVPAYDNTTALMSKLNAVLGSTDDFSLVFDEVDSSAAIVVRGAQISFRCNSLAKARSIMKSLEQDTFACSIDSVNMSVTDTGTVNAGTAAQVGANNVAVSLHANFYENNERAAALAAASEEAQAAAQQ